MSASPKLISPIYKSIIRAIMDMIDDFNNMALVAPAIEYHNWEERALEDNLPSTTLIGTDGFSFDENKGLWIIRFAMGVSSFRDMNLLNEIDLLDHVHQRFHEGAKIALRDVTDGEEVSELLVSDFKLLPMSQSELRNYRTIGLELTRTGR
jgi:hypothetical protein